VSKLSDSESEAAETQVWLDFALEFNYITKEEFETLDSNSTGTPYSVNRISLCPPVAFGLKISDLLKNQIIRGLNRMV
jgi:hypothetical protein